MFTVAIANRKGGTGKTTTAINLAAGLALRGHSVLLVDWDAQKNATTGLGMHNAFGESDGFYRILSSNVPNLDILSSKEDLNLLEEQAIRNQLELTTLKEKLFHVKHSFVIIDCAPSLSWLTLNALAAASHVIIPMQCEFYSLEGLVQLYQIIELMQLRNYSCKIEGIVFTMYDPRSKLTLAVQEDVTKHFTDKVYKTVIPRNIRLAEAPSHGKPCAIYAPRSPGSEAYSALADEFLLRIKNS